MKPNILRITSWTLYDFANTIFSAVILTAFFPLYFTKLIGSKWPLGLATTGAMLIAGCLIPLIGALSDRTGKTKTYLFRTTLLTIIFLGALALFKSPKLMLAAFALSCLFYHLSLVFYNSLLPVVADSKIQGKVSGIGTGLGYLGVVLALPLANIVNERWGEQAVFLLTAVLFFIIALPLFLWVPEREVRHPEKFKRAMFIEEWKNILKLLRKLPAMPHLLLFLGGNFFIVDALNTMIMWFLVYARETFSPQQTDLIGLLMKVNISAFLFGIIAGFLTDKIGAVKTMLLSAGTLVVTLLLLAQSGTFESFGLFCITGAAFAIAGIWTSGRKALIEFSPKEHLGEYFGLYGMTMKLSVVGNLFFGITADVINFKAALLLVLFPASVGFLLLSGSYWILKTRS